jgi:hypothetical protein
MVFHALIVQEEGAEYYAEVRKQYFTMYCIQSSGERTFKLQNLPFLSSVLIGFLKDTRKTDCQN